MVRFVWQLLCVVFAVSFGVQAEETALDNKITKQLHDLPLHLGATLTNSLGIGTFVRGYAKNPDFSTGLSLDPSYDISLPEGWPKMDLAAHIDMNVAWLDAYTSSPNRFSLSDTTLKVAIPKAFELKSTGIFVGTSASLVAPSSKSSLAQARVLGFAAALRAGWEGYGFHVSYAPSATAWAFSGPAKTVPCGSIGIREGKALPNVLNPNNPDFGLERYMWEMASSREAERLPNGRCIVEGRQIVATLKNAVHAAWTYEEHSISLNFQWVIGFLRGLEDRPELKSPYASDRSITESTVGQLAYGYQIPIDFDLSLEGGIISQQTAYSPQGMLRFPFFDFTSPSNNFTQFYVDISVRV